MRRAIGALMLCGVLVSAGGAAAPRQETRAQRDARMAWWREARFGMFIHWGVYAIPGAVWDGKEVGGAGEWLMNNARIPVKDYKPLQKQFNPVKFDAGEWARIARGAGMKYVVITSKHHDGFCLWPSAQTDWDIANSPYGKDILGPLSAACRKEGVKFATYHSIMDWTQPDYQPRRPWDPRPDVPADFARYRAYLKSQLKEIVTSYAPAILWFDGEWEDTWTREMGTDLYWYVRDLKPDIIINNRVDKGRGGMGGLSDSGNVGDYGTPEQEIPAGGLPGVDWESCMTMNDTWGFSRLDHNWKSSTTLVRNLVDCASKGGNYLLNVGPTAEGLIPAESVERLADVGKWMKTNGESIYGTSASPFPRPVPWGAVTQKPGKLYLHVWSAEGGSILLPGLSNRVGQPVLLADRRVKLKAEAVERGLRISLPDPLPDPRATVIVLPITGEPSFAPPPPIQAATDGSLVLDSAVAMAALPVRYETDKKSVGFWTSASATVSWTARFSKPGVYRVTVEQSCEAGTAGAEYAVEVSGSASRGTVAATSGWTDFRRVDLPDLTISKAGEYTVTVRPLKMPGFAVMNLRSVSLTPAG